MTDTDLLHGYYREPTLHTDTLVFVCESELWSVSSAGGRARRLTAHEFEPGSPCLSPDGATLAFTGRHEGRPEVYVMPAAGGVPHRLTFQGSFCTVVGWSKDGKQVLYASLVGQPMRRGKHLWSVPAAGGVPQRLDHGPADRIAYGPNGQVVLGRNVGDPARWKRYRGGRAGDLWIDRKGDGTFARLLSLAGNLADPQWLGRRLFFLSDHEGHGNLYSCNARGKDLTRHTQHEDFYARNAKSDGKRIVYQAGAELWLFDPKQGGSTKIPVEVGSSKPQLTRKFVGAARYLEDYDLHPKGHSLAINARGKAFTMGNWELAVAQLGARDGVRYRLTRWLNDGERLVTISDADGEEALEVHAAVRDPKKPLAPKRLGKLDVGRAFDLVVSPTEDVIAIANQRFELLLVDLKRGALEVLDTSQHGRILGMAFAPDGKSIAYGFQGTRRTSHLRLVDLSKKPKQGRTKTDLTRPVHIDRAPCFDPEGKYLYFLSRRTFNPVYDQIYFDLGFPRGTRPYLIPLQKDQRSPFRPEPRSLFGGDDDKSKPARFDHASAASVGEGLAPSRASSTSVGEGLAPSRASRAKKAPKRKTKKKAAKKKAAKKKAAKKKAAKKKAAKKKATKKKGKADAPKRTVIDLDGIQGRVLAFPVEEGVYGHIVAIAGKVLYDRWPVEGSLGQDWGSDDDAKGTLFSYDLKERKEETYVSGVTSFALAADNKTLAYSSRSKLRVVKADSKPDSDDKVGRAGGTIDLSRPRISIVPAAEWRQMYREAWRLQRDNFWTPDMSEVDWEAVYERYLPVLARVATREEFSDLMWEVQGELGTSHAYEFGGDRRYPPSRGTGRLGADLRCDRRGWLIDAVVRGDSWCPEVDSPLAEPGLDVRAGDRLLAVDDVPLTKTTTPDELLVHRVATDVALVLQRGKQPPRRITVKTLAGEGDLRYRAWVEETRRRVHEASKGKVGYVHVPDMGPRGYSEFHRYYQAEVHHPALIVDVRYNGGGHVSQLLLEKLARRRIGYDIPRYGKPLGYPEDAVLGPIVCLTNEHAGSDGDIFSHCFKLLELGTLIGKRTWGGVVGIWPRHPLVDRTITTQAEFAFWFEDVGWGVENYGTEPDIDVDITPQDWRAGRDPQLDRGLEVVLKQLKEQAPSVPDFKTRPSRLAPRLSHP